MIEDYEKLGAFYLGKQFDLQSSRLENELLLYDAKDLTTHAICVGMTGSGKTGLCVSLLEEAAIDGVPAIAIDPKGDLGNLLLAFPELAPGDFRPWVDEGAAARAGQTPEEYAAQTAARWREGLADWGQTPERIARYADAVDRAIYTPGSSAGLPLTVLRSFAPPPPAVRDDRDAMRERVAAAASGLLALLDIDADPIRSREHILLSTILDHAWREGRHLDVAGLIRAAQEPPFDRVGVFDLETFYPADDRLKLCMQLNNLLASPSFAGWMEGEPLDVARLLYTPEGKPRLSIISIAHLSESERMFFVTILLGEVLAWVRSQPGTSSLRAILYMDEVFGYFPPVANPPSKKPMLTLLKQARAFGLGVVLATQNPVDLDYKGLSNTGTWLLGRLQTERDKARVLEGLEGASAQAGAAFDRARMEATLAGLGSRVFLMNNVHDDQPVVFHSRWAMSYLRGPLARPQIERLMESRKRAPATAASEQAPTAAPQEATRPPVQSSTTDGVPLLSLDDLQFGPAAGPPLDLGTEPNPHAPAKATYRPRLPELVVQRFLAPEDPLPDGARLVYRPALIGRAKIHFVRVTYHVDVWQQRDLLWQVGGEKPADPWPSADPFDPETAAWHEEPLAAAEFARLAPELLRAKTYATLGRKLRDFLYATEELPIWKCADWKQYSRPEETEGDFRARLAHLAREARDDQVDKLRDAYAAKLASLNKRIATTESRLAREKAQARRASYDSAVSIGSSILGALLGRKLASRTNIGRAATSMRSLGRAAGQRGDVGEAQAALEALQQEQADLEQKFQHELEQVERSCRAEDFTLEKLTVRSRKKDLEVDDVWLAWLPWSLDATGAARAAFSLANAPDSFAASPATSVDPTKP